MTERSKMEAEMTRLANMVENLPINVIFADRDNQIQYMNPASTRTLKKLEQQECIVLKRGQIFLGDNKYLPGASAY